MNEKNMGFQVEVFWVMTPSRVVVGHQLFGNLYCLHLQGEVSGMGKNGIDIDLEWRGEAVTASEY